MEEKDNSQTPRPMKSDDNLLLPLLALIISLLLISALIATAPEDDEWHVDDGGPFQYLQTELIDSIEMDAARDLAVTHSVAIGDLDGDGVNEIVTGGVMANASTTSADGDLRVWSYDSETGSYESLDKAMWPLFSSPMLSSIAIADADKDGMNEIVVVAHREPSFILSMISIWNYSAGTLNEEAETNELWGRVLTAVSIIDVDADDDLEIITVGYSKSTTYNRGYIGIWSYDRNGAYISIETSRIWTDDDRTRLFSIVSRDIQGDGNVEMIVTGSGWDQINETPTSEVVIFGLGNGWPYVKQLMTWEGFGAKSSQLTDLDADGVPELVVADTRQVDYTSREYMTVWKFSDSNQEFELWGNGSYDSSKLHVFLEHFSTSCESELCDDTVFTIGSSGGGGTAWGLLLVWEFNKSDRTMKVVEHNLWGEGHGDWTHVYDAILVDVDSDGDPEIVTAGTARGSRAFQVRIWNG